MDVKPGKCVLAGEAMGEESVMEVSAWHIDGPHLPVSGEYKNFRKPRLVYRVNCYRTLMVSEEWDLRIRFWSQN